MPDTFPGNATFPKPLNKSEEKKYLDLYAKGDESAKNVLIEHNLRLVAHIAKKYADEKILRTLYLSAQSVLSKE